MLQNLQMSVWRLTRDIYDALLAAYPNFDIIQPLYDDCVKRKLPIVPQFMKAFKSYIQLYPKVQSLQKILDIVSAKEVISRKVAVKDLISVGSQGLHGQRERPKCKIEEPKDGIFSMKNNRTEIVLKLFLLMFHFDRLLSRLPLVKYKKKHEM